MVNIGKLIYSLWSGILTRTQATAWLVHLYTASGGLLGMFALIFAAHHETRGAFALLIFAMIIDATDGLLARRVKVWEVLPNFDGAEMDNIIDVLTYVWVPVFIMIFEELVPHPFWIFVPIMAAMYAYGQINMKTEDSFFLGFPSYWNIVALYMFWLRPEPPIAILMLVLPGIATFIPTRYLYPSKNQILWKTSWGLGMIWFWMI
jgi:phosphatidylcholine synthase